MIYSSWSKLDLYIIHNHVYIYIIYYRVLVLTIVYPFQSIQGITFAVPLSGVTINLCQGRVWETFEKRLCHPPGVRLGRGGSDFNTMLIIFES